MGLFEEGWDITTNILGKKYKTCPGCNEPISIYHDQASCNNKRLDRRRCKNCGDNITRGSGRKTYCSAYCASEKRIQNPGIRTIKEYEKNENFKSTGIYETNKQREAREDRERRRENRERKNNKEKTGFADTNKEKAEREFYRLQQQKEKNRIQTGISETNLERQRRERVEKKELQEKQDIERRKNNCSICSVPEYLKEFSTQLTEPPTEKEKAKAIDQAVKRINGMSEWAVTSLYCDECIEKINLKYYEKKYSRKKPKFTI